MTPRTKKALTECVASWALWCHTGKVQAPKSLMSRLMENKGVFNFGSAGGSRGPVNSIEERIESAVTKLAAQDLFTADVIRLEFGAGWQNVIKRRRLILKWKDSTQATRAEALKVCERTYRNKLNIGLLFILNELTK
ncbi:MAG: hypothetical protein ACRCXB_22865 [Aeromonadaceae bacterium]